MQFGIPQLLLVVGGIALIVAARQLSRPTPPGATARQGAGAMLLWLLLFVVGVGAWLYAAAKYF